MSSVPLAAAAAACLLPACGGSDAATDGGLGDISQTVEITATEYAFAADASTMIVAGDVVQFRLVNAGDLIHELQILDENGRLLDRVEELAPGASGTVDIGFEEAGVYQFICDVDDHLSRGQQATFRVNEPASE